MTISKFSIFSLTAAALPLMRTVAVAYPATPYYNKDLGCWPISVEHDATYCIDGPVCSGVGRSPTGSLCPMKGDVAIANCDSNVTRDSVGDYCELSVDTVCQVINTGAWGCVIPTNDYPKPDHTKNNYPTHGNPTHGNTTHGNPAHGNSTHGNPAHGYPAHGYPAHGYPAHGYPTHGSYHHSSESGSYSSGSYESGSGSFGNGSIGNGSTAGIETISMQTADTQAASAGGVSAGVIGAVAAAAAAVAAVAGVAIYRQHATTEQKKPADTTVVEVVTP